ncbi:hypothetical protein ACFLR2_01700 [Chlamydiota bacterium]
MRRVLFLLMLIAGYTNVSAAESYHIVNEGPIHEAFVVNEAGALFFEAVPDAPPHKITEVIQKGTDPDAIWIPGYWAWSQKHGVFLWVSGILRRPPPGMQWVPGQWKNYPQGWVWINGFWSGTDPDKLATLPQPPPEPIDQRIPTPPAASDNYFWVPGIWQFDESLQQYVWYAGRWDLMVIHWTYCPAHYVWRENGYIFIPGFWDWPINLRGVAFPSIYVDSSALETFVYEPKHALDTLFIMEQLFPYWPNYACLFHFHYYFYYNVWSAWGAAPPWWNWPAWTGFARPQQWALWWWWSHPDYPNPSWIDKTLAQSIAPPPQFVVEMMRRIPPPPFVTPNGVVSEMVLNQALSEVTGLSLPIFSPDPKQMGQIQEVANPRKKPTPPRFAPTGSNKLTDQPPVKPFLGPSPETLKAPPRRVTLPPQPLVKEEPSQEAEVFQFQPPKTRIKKIAAADIQQPMPPSYPPPFENPWQGFSNPYNYPHHSMQSQHHNTMMGHHQPLCPQLLPIRLHIRKPPPTRGILYYSRI